MNDEPIKTHAPRLGSPLAEQYVPAAQDTSEEWHERYERYKRATLSREEQLRDGWRRRHPVRTPRASHR